MEKIKLAYDELLKAGMLLKYYPDLTGEWEDDEAAFEDIYFEMSDRYDNEN